MLRGPGCSLPIKTARYNKQRHTSILPHVERTLHAVAPQVEEALAATATSTNGNGDCHHDNHYQPPTLQPSTLTVHGERRAMTGDIGVSDGISALSLGIARRLC